MKPALTPLEKFLISDEHLNFVSHNPGSLSGMHCTTQTYPDGSVRRHCDTSPAGTDGGPPTEAQWHHRHPGEDGGPSVFRQPSIKSEMRLIGPAKPKTYLDPAVRKTLGPEGGEITSSDGLFTVTVPPGALGSPTVVSIRRFQSAFQGWGMDVSYELNPDKLQLAVPAKIVYRQPGLKEGAPATTLGQTSETDPEVTVSVPGVVDRVAGTLTVSITRF